MKHKAETNYDQLIGEYTRMAAAYDTRWQTYNQRSLTPTLAAIRSNRIEKLLDIGCGTGLLLGEIRQAVPEAGLTGCDITPAMLELAAHRLGDAVSLQRAAAESLPFDDNSFDTVVCSNSSQYFNDPPQAFREMQRVMVSGGHLILTAWVSDQLLPRIHYRVLQRLHPSVRQVPQSGWYTSLLEQLGYGICSCDVYRYSLWGLCTIKAKLLR